MTDPWDGRPQNPERDGAHWIIGWNNTLFVAEWFSDPNGEFGGEWGWFDGGDYPDGVVANGWKYAGPCLTPADVEARVAAARREGIEAAAKAAKALTHAWRNPQQRHGVAFGEAITGTIRALLTEGER